MPSDRPRGRGFIPFVTAGDPDPATSLAVLLKLEELGSDVIELGVPFSDPVADGPTIQRSSQRALNGGMTLRKTLKLAGEFRRHSDTPIVLFSYFNPIHRFGVTDFLMALADAGIDGVLLTDVIDEEAINFSRECAENNISLIPLIAPTTSDERLERICENASGFVYAIARAGVTGSETIGNSESKRLVQRARQFTDLPIAVGFGISSRTQIEAVWEYADAAVVGSAIVAEIEKAIPTGDVVAAVEIFIKGLLPASENQRVFKNQE